MKTNKKNRKIINIALAILLAMVLWLYVVNVKNPTGSVHLRDLEVQVQGSQTLEDRGLMVTDLNQDTMNLKVTGKKKTLMKLTRKNVFVTVDVASITEEGKWEMLCKTAFPSNVNTDGVSASNWDDLRITVTVQKQSTKSVPVRGVFIGTEENGYLTGTVTTDPKTLALKGPTEQLENVDYALVQVGGEKVSRTIEKEQTVVLMDKEGKPVQDLDLITSDSTSVHVRVPVQRVVSIPLSVSFKGGGGAKPEDVSYEITPSSVYVIVDANKTEPYPDSISLGEIDLSQVYGDTSFSLPIKIPDGLTKWASPNYASVTVSMEHLESRQIAVENFSLINVRQGYTPNLVSPKLYVWVRGEAGRVRELKPEDLTVEVDLSQAVPGSGIQRFPAQIGFAQGKGEGVGVVGTQYSVALRLTQ